MTSLGFSDYATRLRGFIRQSLEVDPPADEVNAETFFAKSALAAFELQFAGNPPYRRFCQSRGVTPESISSWTEIPAIPVAAFKEVELMSLAGPGTAVFHSSGTTGQKPSRHFHNAESLELYEESLLAWFRMHMLPDFAEPEEAIVTPGGCPATPMIFLTPPSALVPHSSLVYMFESVRRTFGAPDSVFSGWVEKDGGWRIDLEQSWLRLSAAEKTGRPVMLLGTAFNFVHLLDHLAAKKLALQLLSGSRALETGGYKGRTREIPKPALHSLISEYLGIPPGGIICEYGMSELSSQAYDRKAHDSSEAPRLFRFPPWARAQIISPETGREVGEEEMGLVRVFDLANIGSVIAIQTEDLAIRRGLGFELVGRARLGEPRGCSLMPA